MSTPNLEAAGNKWQVVKDPRTLSAEGAMTCPGDNEFNRDALLGPYLVYKLPQDVAPGESTADGKVWQIWIRMRAPTGRNSFWWQLSADGVTWTPATFTNANRWESRISSSPQWFWNDQLTNNAGAADPVLAVGANYLRIAPRESDPLPSAPLFDVICLRNFGTLGANQETPDDAVVEQLPCPVTEGPCLLRPPPPGKFVTEFLITPSMQAPPGCGVTPAQINGDWLSDGAGLTDANIVPRDGLEFHPAFGAASQALGWDTDVNGMSPAAQARFLVNPADPASLGRILLIKSPFNEVYDYQRGDIFGADANDTMAVGFFYVVNPTGSKQVRRMGFGSDDGGGVRVNGRPALTMQACRGTTAGQDKFQVCLDPGKNLISFYAFEQGGGYGAAIRFEDEEGFPVLVETTTDPTGYTPDPDGSLGIHPLCDAPPLPPTFVTEVLVTPSMKAPPGCGVTAAQIAGDWLSDGGDVTDGGIVPEEGFEFLPDFTAPGVAGASQALGWDPLISGAAQQKFWTDPGAPGFTFGKLVKVGTTNGIYDYQRGDIFGADIDNTMCVAFFYAINESQSVQTFNLGFGSDDGGGVRVNGRPALSMQACRGVTPGQDKFRVCLDPGKNLISFYTFEQGGGYGAAIRFEKLNGAPISVPTTLDPAGYEPDPDGTLGKHPICTPEPYPPAGVYTGLGFVAEFLVPAAPLDNKATGTPPANSNTKDGAVPQDYITIDGGAPSAANVREGAAVGAGSSGDITTGVRGGAGCSTYLTRFVGRVGADPGLFNGEVFYAPPGDPNNYSSSIFFFLNNKTGADYPISVGFASDDAGTFFVNGNRILQHLAGRGYGGANTIQNGPELAVLSPGVNLVQFSYNEGGGGSGARVAVFDKCGGLLERTKVEVSANPPGFEPGPAPPCKVISCAGDTHCTGLTVAGAPDFDVGPHIATATATDDNGGTILYTFKADNGVDPPLVVGPTAENSAMFDLTGACAANKKQWTFSVSVDDEGDCDVAAADAGCTKNFELSCPPPQTWIRGDTNGDRVLDISDAVGSLGYQFVGAAAPQCLAALDVNEDGVTDISDPVKQLGILFLGEPLPALFRKCENFIGCQVNCP